MRLVVDTNVLVSGLLSAHGPPGLIMSEIMTGEVSLCLDHRILLEYQEVLSRPCFSFEKREVWMLLAAVQAQSELITCQRLDISLPDPDDLPFLEVALSAMAEGLVTGNSAHFPSKMCQGVRVLTPREYVDERLQSR